MRRMFKWTGIGCGCLTALFVFLFGAMVVMGMMGLLDRPATAPASPVPVVAAKPTATVAAPPTAPPATATVQPPATPTAGPPTAVPPTAVPAAAVPTPAAPPKPEPKPTGPSPETRAYLEWLRPKLEVAGQALSGLAAQSQLANQNPRLLADNDWRIKTAVALGFMSNAGKEMQAYSGVVPPEAQKLDAMTKDLGKDLEYISAEYAAGIDQTSPVRLGNAVARMNGLPAKTQAATAEIRTLTGQ